MTFGSDELKYMLLNMVDGETRDNVLMLLYEIIERYALHKISSGFKDGEIYSCGDKKSKPLYTESIPLEDRKDIAGDIFCDVIKKLDDFIENISNNDFNEKQRQAWLRKIVYCKCASYLRKVGKIDYIIDTGIENEEVAYIPVSACKSPEYIALCNDIIRNTIIVACNAPFKPEKIMAYLYNISIFKEIEGRKVNALSSKTCDYMNNKKLFVLKREYPKMFNELYTLCITEKEIEPLSDELGYDEPTIKGNELFLATPKLIADWSNRMKTYIYKAKYNILDDGGEYLVK